MSIKISFMHYMKWTRVMSPEFSEEFELVCILLLFFFFSLLPSISKTSTLAKIWVHPRACETLFKVEKEAVDYY